MTFFTTLKKFSSLNNWMSSCKIFWLLNKWMKKLTFWSNFRCLSSSKLLCEDKAPRFEIKKNPSQNTASQSFLFGNNFLLEAYSSWFAIPFFGFVAFVPSNTALRPRLFGGNYLGSNYSLKTTTKKAENQVISAELSQAFAQQNPEKLFFSSNWYKIGILSECFQN